MAQTLDREGAGTLLEGTMTVRTIHVGTADDGWETTAYNNRSVGDLSVSPKFEVEGVEFELTRIATVGSDLELWLAGSGFGRDGAGGAAEARRWVLHLEGEAFRFDAADKLFATQVEWSGRAPPWQSGRRVPIRLERLPRPDPVLNSDGSETVWEAMVGVGRAQLAQNIGYVRSSTRGSADPDEFDFEGATYDVQRLDWHETVGAWRLLFYVDGTRPLPETARFLRRAFLEVDGERIDFLGAFTRVSENFVQYSIPVDAPTYSDGDDLDVRLILRNAPTKPREVSAAVDGSTVVLRWTRPRRTGGSPITHYIINRSDDGGGDWNFVAVIDASTTTYTDAGVPEARRPLYRVRATGKIGDGPWARDTVPALVRIDVVSTPVAGDTYLLGEAIDAVATFDQSVWVRGVAELALLVDDGLVRARYAYGAGTSRLTFRYLVRAGDIAADGISVGKNALGHDGVGDGRVRGGGAIHSVRGTDAALVNAMGDELPGHKVDGDRWQDDGERVWLGLLTVGKTAVSDVVGYARGGVGTDGALGTLSPDTFSHESPDGTCHHAVHNLHYRLDDNGDWWFVFEYTGLPDDPFERYGVLRLARTNGERLAAFVLAKAEKYDRPSHTTAAWWKTDPPGTTPQGAVRDVTLVLLNPTSEAPSNLGIVPFGAALQLTWDAPANPGSGAVNGYRIEHAPETDPDNWSVLVDNTFSAAPEHFLRVGAGTRAYYRVRALGLGGAASEPSNEEFAETEAPPAEEGTADLVGTEVWSATLTSGAGQFATLDYVGYGVENLSIGTLQPDTFRYRGTDHTVSAVAQSSPGMASYAFGFAVRPALPEELEGGTLEVAGRRFDLRDALVHEGKSQSWSWGLDEAILEAGESVPVRLLTSIVPVKRSSALIPPDIGVGERYRLMFVTGNLAAGQGAGQIDGRSFLVEEYNRAVRARARAGSHPGNPIANLSDTFKALASTPGTDARDNAGTGGFALFTEGVTLLHAEMEVGGDITTTLGFSPNLGRGALDPESFTYRDETYEVDALWEETGGCPGGTRLRLEMNGEAQRLADLGAVLEVGDERFELGGVASVASGKLVAFWCDPGLDWKAGEFLRVRIRLPAAPDADLGVPVYWLNGANEWSLPDHPDERTPWVRVADDYAELHSGLWPGATAPRDEWGEEPCISPPCIVRVATGSRADGTADPGYELGMPEIRGGALNDPDAFGPLNARVLVPRDGSIRLYGISPVLEVRATKPSVWGVRASRDKADEIEVTWRLRDNGAPLTSLKVQRRVDREWVDATDELDAAARSHLFEDLIHTARERYRVVAENREGRTVSRDHWGATAGPTRPRISSFTASTNLVRAIRLSWTVRDNGSPLTSLAVEEFDFGAESWSVAWNAPTDRPSGEHLFENLDDGISWTVRLRAVNGVGTTVSAQVTGQALREFTASFAPETDPHDGAGTTFERDVEFDQGGSVEAADLCDVLDVRNGTCRSSRRGVVQNEFDDEVEAWRVTIAPEGDADVTLTLQAPTDCDAAGAVCSTDGRPLAETVTHTVAGPGSMTAVPLTAEFVAGSVPGGHDGAGTSFTLQVRFNQDADVEDLCAALEVTDGTCTAAAHEVGDTSLWDLTIVPDGGKPVTVALGETTDCAAASAVCTADDTPLTSAISVTVSPPQLEASWESLPDTHAGGGTTYSARVRFSEDVDITDLCAAFEITDGTCESSAKVGDRADLWEIVVAPDGPDDLTLSLGFTADCEAAGAVCTADDNPLAHGLFAVVSRVPLTVALVSLPEEHGGVDTTFTVQLRFSEAVDVDDLCDAVSLLDATCGSSAVDAADADLWEVVVAPDGAAEVFFVLADKDCGHDDAVCTADGEQLSNSILESVPRRPLTAAWVDGSWPAAHEGAGTDFTVRVRFSEDAIVSYLVLRDEALEVTNGNCDEFRRVDGRKDLWEARIAPDGTAAVSLLLDSPADCDASDAVCTQDDSPLTTRLELTVPGPATSGAVLDEPGREHPGTERR